MATRKTFNEGVRPMLVSEALRIFLHEKEVGGLSPRTVHWYKSCLDMFIEFIGDKPVAKLTLDDGQRWILHQMHGDRYEGHPHRKKIEGTIAIPALNGRIRAIKNFSKYLEEEALTSEDIFRKLRQHKDTKRVVEPTVSMMPETTLPPNSVYNSDRESCTCYTKRPFNPVEMATTRPT